jgi:hypothetical protein
MTTAPSDKPSPVARPVVRIVLNAPEGVELQLTVNGWEPLISTRAKNREG